MKKILICDDDHDLLELTTLVLQREGFQVEILDDSRNVVNDVNRIAPDIILMDLWMPEVQGDDAIKLLKENHKTQHIPVILFSAYPKLEQIANVKQIKLCVLVPSWY